MLHKTSWKYKTTSQQLLLLLMWKKGKAELSNLFCWGLHAILDPFGNYWNNSRAPEGIKVATGTIWWATISFFQKIINSLGQYLLKIVINGKTDDFGFFFDFLKEINPDLVKIRLEIIAVQRLGNLCNTRLKNRLQNLFLGPIIAIKGSTGYTCTLNQFWYGNLFKVFFLQQLQERNFDGFSPCFLG